MSYQKKPNFDTDDFIRNCRNTFLSSKAVCAKRVQISPKLGLAYTLIDHSLTMHQIDYQMALP